MAKTLFRFNTRELSKNVQAELNNSELKARRAMDAVGGFVNGEVKDRTPQDDGFLTADISNKTVKYKNSYATVIFVPSNAVSSSYAILMHENHYQLGEKSRDKRSKVGKMIGRKFITRGIDENRPTIRKIVESELKI